MTTTAQPRVKPGVPAGGEFTTYGHSDDVATLGVPISNQEKTYLGLISDTLDSHGEAAAARSAVGDSLIAGDFGEDTMTVRELLDDDRLLRMAVDRFVVRDFDEPGSQQPEQTGQFLGRYLIELRNEDIADAENGLEWSE